MSFPRIGTVFNRRITYCWDIFLTSTPCNITDWQVQQIFAFLCKSVEVYSELFQTSKMECFAKIVKRWKPLTTLAKHSISDIWQGSESLIYLKFWFKLCILARLNWWPTSLSCKDWILTKVLSILSSLTKLRPLRFYFAPVCSLWPFIFLKN